MEGLGVDFFKLSIMLDDVIISKVIDGLKSFLIVNVGAVFKSS